MHYVSLGIEYFLAGEGVAADVSDHLGKCDRHLVFQLRGHEHAGQADQVQVLQGQEVRVAREVREAVDK